MTLKKLVIATDNYLPRHDGVARFLQEILPRLTAKFHVTLICPRFERIPPIPDVHLVTIPLSKKHMGDFTLARWKPRLIHNALKGADLVFTQTIGPIGATTIFLARQQLRTTAAYIHSLDWEVAFQAVAPMFAKRIVPFLGRRWARFLYRRAQRLFMPSDGISEQFTWEGIHTSRRIIHLGVNTKQFVPGSTAQKKDIREQLGFHEDELVIGYHGRIAREKDLSTLVRAYVKLRGSYPQLRLLLIGNGVSSLEKKFAAQPGVVLYPAVNDVEKFLPAMDMYVLPSLTETTSLSVLEAMSCALPVIATPVGFVKDYITVNKTGLLTKKKDSYELAKKIKKLIDKPELRESMGKEARKMVQQKFNWDETAKHLVEELEALL